ncbi:MAG: Asp-tRNA(Asn)/Glu-tRNA(Gln) amidotransferase subunit GatA [Firmicutes bacterium]|mgnify:CR=1 FL=1|nr:Asp-tRNA(Asn)/Glu-tRNA(Gln) amidotransferase subunit GatA [Bacillota bacterium]
MITKLTIAEAADKLAKKEISAYELAEAALQRIEETDEKVKAFLRVTKDEALKKAAEIDEKRRQGEELGALAGIPVAYKDNICTEGVLTTCASKMLHNFVPPYSATVVELLQQAGSVMLGKTNLDEFAIGSSTENSAFFTTHNPWDLKRVAGGSSGGSAAAVAAGQVLFALGTDTGGSIRQPAAFCGVVGLKPTYGLISRYGVVAFSSSLDQVGPVTKNVEDCALVLNVLAKHDPRDSTSVKREIPDYAGALTGEVKGLKIGVPKEYFGDGIDPQVKAVVRKALDVLLSLGAEAEEISLPLTEYGVPVYYLIAPAEASSNLARFDGIRYGYRAEADDLEEMYTKTRSEGFGAEVKRRILLGTYALSAERFADFYLKALKVRTLIKQDFDRAFAKFDLLLTPTTPNVSYIKGEVQDLLTEYMNDYCTIGASLAGLPAISVPCGYVNGLPVGMQLIGKPFAEPTILRVAHAYEQNCGLERKIPTLTEMGGSPSE